MENEKLAIFWEQYLSGQMSKAERTEFRLLLEDPENQEYFEHLLNSSMHNPEIPLQPDGKKEKHILDVLGKISVNTTPVVHRTHFLRRRWFRYAAAILMILGVGAYFLFFPSRKQEVATGNISDYVKEFKPGTDKAVLILGDGTFMELDSAGNGTIAEQGKTQIMKNADGKITYGGNDYEAAGNITNTLHTPYGGKYQLSLSDGTKIWMNAASSITFPVVFAKNERTVTVSGEVYFEVAPDKARPFIVSSGNAQVQVLGTSFNVSAYEDEDEIKVTLVNGAVKVTAVQSKQTSILNPGQQVQLSADRLSANNQVDIHQVIAWKNDLFNFEDINLEDAMRQISRWYGVKVVYEKNIPKTQLWGKMSRNTSFERMLRNLKDVGVNYKMNAKRELIILP